MSYKLVQKKEENVIHSLDELPDEPSNYVILAINNSIMLILQYTDYNGYNWYSIKYGGGDGYSNSQGLECPEEAVNFIQNQGYEIHIFTPEEIKDKLFE